jgi:endo-1,4-beta-mannosidase
MHAKVLTLVILATLCLTPFSSVQYNVALADDEFPNFDIQDGSTLFSSKKSIDTVDGHFATFAIDMDDDGDVDIVSTSTVVDDVYWYENNGSESFTRHTIDSGFRDSYQVWAGDIDNDSDIDVVGVAYHYSSDGLTWWENDGSESFTTHSISSNIDAFGIYGEDVDGDGDIDFITAERYVGDRASWWENDGSESFTKRNFASIQESDYARPEDLDEDGDIDILVSSGGSEDKLYWYENDGSESFTQHTIDSDFDDGKMMVTEDVDGDGDIDVVAVAKVADELNWYENNGSESFTEHNVDNTLDSATEVAAADFDKDGDIDLAATARGSDEVSWYENDGSENFTKHTLASSFDGAGLTIIDLDGDGDIDIIANDYEGDNLVWFENELTEGFNSGYPYSEKSFQVDEFIQTDGMNFTLGGEPYTFIGSDAYYLADYACNTTYDDDGNEITNSRQYVLEILNEANHLNINVLRTWAGMQGGEDSHWERSKVGGHWNLFEIDDPGNWSEDTYAALDWVVYQAKQRDIRLMPVFVNQWNDYGGMRWYVNQSPTTDKTNASYDDISSDEWHQFKDQFYTDENCRQYYKNAVSKLLNRNNTYTGVQYKDEPTIFGWCLANEPRVKSAGTNHTILTEWVTNMTAYIKSIDTNHTVGAGVEGWGMNEDWGEGYNLWDAQNDTGVDFATCALHPDEWAYLAERSEGDDDNEWITDNVESDKFINWWTNSTNLTYNNRYSSGNVPKFIPNEGRHGYDAWTIQQVKWANEMGLPIVCQEVGYKSSHPDAVRNKFFEQAIYNFYNAGGDGMMYWTLNHDNYYFSTDTPGDMDDGYGFYVSTNETLATKSQAVLDAFNYSKTNNSGDSWVTLLNDKKYNYVTNIGDIGETIDNVTLHLSIYNESGIQRNDSVINTTAIVADTDYTFNYQFESDDTNVTWYMVINTDAEQITSESTFDQFSNVIPDITINSPEDNYKTLNAMITFNYSVASDIEITKAELYIDDIAVDNDTSVTVDTYQEFVRTLDVGPHEWYIKVTNEYGHTDESIPRDLEVTIVPEPPTSFIATADGWNEIDLSWTKGDNATHTYIRYAIGNTPPSTRSTGTLLYNGTENTATLTDAIQDTEYSFTAWSFGTGGFNETNATTTETTDAAFTSGSGTEEDPYIVTSDNLNAIRNDPGNVFQLYNNITELGSWDPIPDFNGTFDGNNKTINAMEIIQTGSDIGFFEKIIEGATVKYLGLTEVLIDGAQNTGGLVGSANNGQIIECYVTGDVSGSSYVGGLIGKSLSDATVTESYSKGSVTGTNYAGGFIGENGGIITNCYTQSNITRPSGTNTYIAAFAGYNSQGNITNCYATGNITFNEANPTSKGFVGGVATGGDYYDSGNFFDNQTTGQATTSGNAVGKNTADMKSWATYNAAGWDIVNYSEWNGETWYIGSYPHLGGEFEPMGDEEETGGANDTINVTLSPQGTADILINRTTWSPTIGIMENTSTSATAFNLDNNGSISVSITVNVSNTVNWTVATTPGHNQFNMSFTIGSGWIILQNSPQTFIENLAYNEDQDFGLQLYMPTSSETNTNQTATITFVATAD